MSHNQAQLIEKSCIIPHHTSSCLIHCVIYGIPTGQQGFCVVAMTQAWCPWGVEPCHACRLYPAARFPLRHTILTKPPSLCLFRPDFVPRQIQVLQSKVLSEAFGQGLTGEIWWTSSPPLLIKLWVNSFLPVRENFSSYWTKGWGMDGFGMRYVSFNIKFAHICSLTALERYLPKKNLNPSQSDQHKTTSEESQCICRFATLRSTKIHFAMHSFQSPWTFHWLHLQVTVSWSFLYVLSLPTILTKHQAFAPSAPISFRCKSRFFRVEFSLRPSAKAWQENSGPWVQLLNWSNSESSQS